MSFLIVSLKVLAFLPDYYFSFICGSFVTDVPSIFVVFSTLSWPATSLIYALVTYPFGRCIASTVLKVVVRAPNRYIRGIHLKNSFSTMFVFVISYVFISFGCYLSRITVSSIAIPHSVEFSPCGSLSTNHSPIPGLS